MAQILLNDATRRSYRVHVDQPSTESDASISSYLVAHTNTLRRHDIEEMGLAREM